MRHLVFFLLISGFSLHAYATDPCSSVNISLNETEDGVGLYSFILDPDIPAGATLEEVLWNFGDGNLVTNNFQTMSHQYFAQNQPFTVTVTCFYEPENGSPFSCSTTIVIPPFTGTYPCPNPVFIQTTSCGVGEMSFSWNWCDNVNYGSGLTSGTFWTLDYVSWDFGDGSTSTTQGTLPGVHTFSSSITYNVTGTVYFTGQNGEECEAMIANVSVNACDFENDLSIIHSYSQEVTPSIAAPEFYIVSSNGINCSSTTFSLINSGSIVPTPASYADWSYELFVDGISVTSGSGIPPTSSPIYSSSLPANDYLFELVYTYQEYEMSPCSASYASTVTFDTCPEPCTNCSSFKPYADERYWLSAWVKEEHVNQVLDYTDSYIKIGFVGANSDVEFYPEGEIIEGWQRIIGDFTIPFNTSALNIELLNDNSVLDAYFDDIRIHPFNASMKSYVYDPETFWLTAELDDNNYATFYEYDKEGQLVRIKKETARGIMTIQESRSNNPKQPE